MPVTIPVIDDRRYQDLLDEALARIPVHTPEWTNYSSESDPGVTLLELFSFLTENLLYRANQIPERNRRKFLTLLGVPLAAGGSASGLVVFANDRGPLKTFTLNDGLEVRAGEVPFRTTATIDVLPIETRLYYKKERLNAPEELKQYYRMLYASFRTDPVPPEVKLYDTVAFTPEDATVVDLGAAIDRSLWIALVARASDVAQRGRETALKDAREQIEGKTLSLGIVPALAEGSRDLHPGLAGPSGMPLVQYWIPKLEADGGLPADRTPQYRQLTAQPSVDVLDVPGVVQITLPARGDLAIWNDLNPLDAGVGDFPPAIADTAIDDRIITWLRVRPAAAATSARLLWAGINAAPIAQRARALNERLPDGTGEPDQSVTLAHAPVVEGSVAITVDNSPPWAPIDDLFAAGPEVAVSDQRKPPGNDRAAPAPSDVFLLDAEAGQIRFGDGARGRRPARGAVIRATYDYAVGAMGNVGPRSINSGPALPAGITVFNPVRTWGGSPAETAVDGERQIARYLQHRDRLVTAEDFRTITQRTPGVDIGRVDVLAAYNPALTADEPGSAPGAVTLLVIPRHDPDRPDAPLPDRLFLDAICAYLEPRRLVTTEVFLRGPVYQQIWISVGIKPAGGMSVPKVREAVRQELLDFLSPLDRERKQDDGTVRAYEAWPLRKPVVDRELMAVASRVKGVTLVTRVLVALDTGAATSEIPMSGLQLPRVMGISVVEGDPVDLAQLRGAVTPDAPPKTFVPVPIVPVEC
jgi:hypothetical protein